MVGFCEVKKECMQEASKLAQPGVKSINRERLSVTNLSSENNFADVSTECSSCHQGESERSAKTMLLFIAIHY